MVSDADAAELPTLADAHDGRHQLSRKAPSRESAAFMFALPDEGLGGFLYTWVDNRGLAGSVTCLFGAATDEPIKERFSDIAVPEDMGFRDWKVGALQMRNGEPHRSVDLAFSGQRVQLHCHYEALHPPYAFGFHKDGCPAYYADDRTEQHGTLTGELTVDGKPYALNTYMQRDHSWGTRIWGLNQHYKWFHATTPSAAVHFFEMQSFGRTLLRGYVFKDGQMSEIRHVEYEIEYDENMHHEAISVMATDAAGRKTWINSTVFAKFQYDVDPMIILNEGVTKTEIDGEVGSGWWEFCWNSNYYDFAKRLVSQYGQAPAG